MAKKKDFLFVDLSTLPDVTKPIDGMAAGVFTDMWGYEFEIKAEDLPEYVLKTNMALQSTRDSDGNVVGFPIDTMNHNHREAAGWILDAKQVGGTIQVSTRWNDLGSELIGSDQMRYFSPTIDLEAKVIIGGSLTNWPATRTKDHQILLRPVELSEQLQALDDVGFMTRIELMFNRVIDGLAPRLPDKTQPNPTEEDMEFEQLTPEQRETLLAQAFTSGTLPAELQAQIDNRAAELANVKIAAEQRASHIAELTDRLAGGTDEKPYGLPIPADELASFLTSLSPEAQTQAEGILSRISESGMIDFAERGTSQRQTGNAVLSKEIAASLRNWLKVEGQTIEEFFDINQAELGSIGDYNLAEFKEK